VCATQASFKILKRHTTLLYHIYVYEIDDVCLEGSKLKLGTTNMTINMHFFEIFYEIIKFTYEISLGIAQNCVPQQIYIQMVKKDI
jgi:hypothetical protein